MCQQHTVHFAERCDRDAVQDVVAVGEKHFRRADQRSVQFIASEQLGESGGGGENDLVLDTARERHRVKIGY